MIRVSRMADYGVVAMTHIAREPRARHTAASIAVQTGVPQPSASKLLKQLAKAGILTSHRGAKGGYVLAHAPEQVSVADLVAAVDGADFACRLPRRPLRYLRAGELLLGARSLAKDQRRDPRGAGGGDLGGHGPGGGGRGRLGARRLSPRAGSTHRERPAGPPRRRSSLTPASATSMASSPTSRPTPHPPDLDHDTIRFISAKKGEPEWLLAWRIKAFERWLEMEDEEPTWAKLHYPPIDYQDACYYSAPKSDSDRPKSLDEVDPELLATYEKLGIPLQGAGDAGGRRCRRGVFDSVSVATTFKDKLAELGIVFCSISEAVKEHSRTGAALSRLRGALFGQLLRHAELGGVHRRPPSSTCRRACAARWSFQPTSVSTPPTPASSSAR